MKIVLSIMVLGLLLQGCGSTKTLTFEPEELDGQQMVLQDGVEAVFSPKKALVTVRPGATTYSSDARPTFFVTVVNSTEEPFDFSTEDIQVFVDGEPHKVFTYDELVEDVKRQQPLIDNNRTEQFLSVLQTTALQQATVLPRSWHSGYVTLEEIPDADRSHDMNMVIRAAGEEHEFLLKHFKDEQ